MVGTPVDGVAGVAALLQEARDTRAKQVSENLAAFDGTLGIGETLEVFGEFALVGRSVVDRTQAMAVAG